MRKNDDFVQAFCVLGESLYVNPDLRKILERFVCGLYGFTDEQQQNYSVNEARFRLFKKGKFSEEFLPPTHDVLQLHIDRANYQSYIWKNCLTTILDMPSFEDHGWVVADESVTVKWMLLPIAPDSVLSFVSCSCKKGCDNNRCSCTRAKLNCSDLCHCHGCQNTINRMDSDDEDVYDNAQDSCDSDSDTYDEVSHEDAEGVPSEWETSEYDSELSK